jgi:hypothetical protein
MEITSAMEAFLEQERRAITENIRRTGVHLTYVAVAAAEGDEPACSVPATPSSSCWVFHLERRPPC